MRYNIYFKVAIIAVFLLFILIVVKDVTHLITFDDYEENGTQTKSKQLPCCKWDENILVGALFIDQNPVDLTEIRKSDKSLDDVKRGGWWSPKECKAKAKVAIIVPLRHRENHLAVLLRHLHPVLQRQKLDYRIFVINQADSYPFNRAKLLNIGFNESTAYDDYECFVFHDVDLIPEDDRNDYGCPSGPRHMCPAVSKFDYKLFSPYLFGGVTAFTKRDFHKVNGYPNRYYGWGAEDDDMFHRIRAKGIRIVRPPLETGRYTMIVHKDEDRNSKAKQLLKDAGDYKDKDGLNTLRYKVAARHNRDFCTEIEVDVAMTEEEKQLTSLKEQG